MPIPEFRIHGTGQTEYALLPAVRDLRKAILKKYESLNTTEVPTETQRLHTEQGWFYGLHHMLADNDGIAPSTDSLYLRTKESFGTLGEDEFVIVYGVNHHLTGKAMYENVTVYGLTHQVTADDVDDTQLAGSATDYLPANKIPHAVAMVVGDADPTDPRVSVINADLSGLPPLLVLHFACKAYEAAGAHDRCEALRTSSAN